MHATRQTRSGTVFSPYDIATSLDEVVTVRAELGSWVKQAFDRELRRDKMGLGDTEGWPLSHSALAAPSSSLLSSPPLPLASTPCPSTAFTTLATCDRLTGEPKRKSQRGKEPEVAKRKLAGSEYMSPPPPLPLSYAPPAFLATPPLAAPTTSSNVGDSQRKTRKQVGKAQRRARHRANKNDDPIHGKIRSSTSRAYSNIQTIKTRTKVSQLPVASAAWIGGVTKVLPRNYTLDELLAEGFRLVEWDARANKCITDQEDKLFVLLGAPPKDPDWPAVVERVRAKLKVAGNRLVFPVERDRRGPFNTISIGLSYGGGQPRPGILCHTAHNRRIMEWLMKDPDVRRVFGHANSLFRFFFPKMFIEYKEVLDIILKNQPGLPLPLGNSIFSAAAFNFGPVVTTLEHADFLNKANGICPIFCSGTFDSTKGGHIILRQLKLVIQFPAGSFILLPSAALFHGNAAIQPGEERESVTQFTAGGLFRWVYYGCRSWTSLVLENGKEFEKEERAKHEARWLAAVQQFSTVGSLPADREPLIY